jgi:hypothetical protein
MMSSDIAELDCNRNFVEDKPHKVVEMPLVVVVGRMGD